MLGAITRQISRLSLCTLRLKPGSTLARAPTLIRPSGLATPATQQTRLFSVASKQKNQKLLNQLLARPIVFRHYTTEVPSTVEPKFEDDLEEEFEKEMASKLSSTQLSDYYYHKIANELNLSINQVKNTAQLLKEENTIHFITRYRKEMTGGLSEHEVRDIEKRYNEFVKVEIRKQFIIESMTKRLPDKLTAELRTEIQKADTMAVLEDLYAPYKQRKRNKATVARELGLGALADSLLTESYSDEQLDAKIKHEINPEKELNYESITEHLTNVLTETFTYHTANVQKLRDMFNRGAILNVSAAPKKKKKTEDGKSMDIDIPTSNKKAEDVYETYYNFSKPVPSLKPYQTLAINRGEKEGFLKVRLDVADSSMTSDMEKIIKKSFPVLDKSGPKVKAIISAATKEAYNRIKDTLEREIRRISKEKAESRSIEVFTSNLKHLLLTRPVYGRILGVDPGFRNGCKLAAIDTNGRVLYTGIIYPHTRSSSEPQDIFCELIRKFNVKLIAIGNGVASRETEQFVSRSVQSMDKSDIYWTIVSEAGASVYSTSKEANKEFPELDASLRGAISIARRLQDPLGELVKVPTKSMGIGMYQHDINQSSLTKALDATVEDCVNFVGVNLNTASVPLLSYVSGISQSQAAKIVDYRDQHQAFKSREELFQVGGIAQKTFTQAAGFLKIPKGKNPLDNTFIHPESYSQTEKLLKKIDFNLKHVADPESHKELTEKLATLDIAKLSEELGIGQPTLIDIISDLAKPGLDPRDNLQKPLFRKDIAKESDLKPGMVVCGVVSNVLDFGAFIDIGVGNQLLLHRTDMIAKDGNTRVSDPLQCVELGQVLTLVVKDKDAKSAHQKLTLSMKGVPEGKPANLSDQPDVEFKEEEFDSVQVQVTDALDEIPAPSKPVKSTKRKAAEDVIEDEPKPKRRKVAVKEERTENTSETVKEDIKPVKTPKSKPKEAAQVSEEVKPKRARSATKKSETNVEEVDVAVREESKPKRGRKKAVEVEKIEQKLEDDPAAVEKPKRGRPKKSVQ